MTTDSTLINMVKGHAVMTSRMSYFFAIIFLLLAALLRMADLANVPAGFSEDEIINIRLVDKRSTGRYLRFLSRRGRRSGGHLPRVRRLCDPLCGRGHHWIPDSFCMVELGFYRDHLHAWQAPVQSHSRCHVVGFGGCQPEQYYSCAQCHQ